ncbi:hypothetical protein HO173_006065 [Letharia columbiana]|uniref:Ketosynthase family 3 (KS3) domain-containing protein n=1 Tax=Letharia columbiana TaxID=112416 RepID=A0A8H6FWA9_9LECA|nr:uncharacterized protein HO173_006065 [Letharia columbiana]KAF6235869.1 hypothetical protein HO173_006065 [Letharia columbiana]
MEPPTQIFIFGDQKNASDADLRQLLHVNDNSVLRSFFERVNYALRVEIARLPVIQQEWFPRYNTLLELLTARRRGFGDNPALGLALLCINQLGRTIVKDHGDILTARPVHAVGLCTGSFAAAAISTSQTIAELLPAAIEAVLVAFRTGLGSFEARNDIEPRSVVPPIWPVIVGMQEEQAAAILDAFLMQMVFRRVQDLTPSGKPEQSKIAIVGYGGRFPDAESIDKFYWDILHKGLDVHRKIPEDRFDVATHYDPTGRKKNTSKVQYGCFIEKPGLFDARFFNMSPRESANADPGQRLAITTAYEALEMAGFGPDTTPSTQRDRVGIFYGMTSDD